MRGRATVGDATIVPDIGGTAPEASAVASLMASLLPLDNADFFNGLEVGEHGAEWEVQTMRLGEEIGYGCRWKRGGVRQEFGGFIEEVEIPGVEFAGKEEFIDQAVEPLLEIGNHQAPLREIGGLGPMHMNQGFGEHFTAFLLLGSGGGNRKLLKSFWLNLKPPCLSTNTLLA